MEVIPQINTFIDNFTRLFNQNIADRVRQEISQLEQQDQLRVIKSFDILSVQLLEIDGKLSEFYKLHLTQFGNDIRDSWNALIEQLARLQTLSLIVRIPKCETTIDLLIDLMGQKIDMLNSVLDANMEDVNEVAAPAPAPAPVQAGGMLENYDDYQYLFKYIKYLTKNINS